MDTSERTGGSKAQASSRTGWRTRLGWAHAGASLAVVASVLSDCASHVMTKVLGPDPSLYPPVVERYEWAGRRGDELVVVYRVWGGHPRRYETRWTVIDLRTATWVTGLGAPGVGELGDRPGEVLARESTDLVPVVQFMGGPLEQEVALARSRSHAAASAPVAIYGRGGASPRGARRDRATPVGIVGAPAGAGRVGAAAVGARGGRGGGPGDGACPDPPVMLGVVRVH